MGVSPTDAAREAVMKARNDLNVVKQLVSRLDTSESHAQVLAGIKAKIESRESTLANAEKAVEATRIRLRSQTQGVPRQREILNPIQQARYALAVIGNGPALGPLPKAERKATLTPLRQEQLINVINALSTRLPSFMSLQVAPNGMHVTVHDTFIAGIWFTDSPFAGVMIEGTLEPEHVNVVGRREPLSRWSVSQHTVFRLLSERATAAAYFFWRKDISGVDSLFRLLVGRKAYALPVHFALMPLQLVVHSPNHPNIVLPRIG
uniref:Uncharacterized protein n=1 Tax=Compsopogon caeruleus TaxID=31354 RepID=A0A7S1XE69_9RHOD